MDPKLATAYDNRGDAKRTKGDNDGANADFARATALDPKLVAPPVEQVNPK